MNGPSLKKQLISSVVSLALIAVFLVVSVTTYSWFANAERTRATGLQVSADENFNDSAVRLCPVTEISGDDYVFLSGTSVSSLPKYDKYNIDVSEYERAAVMMISFTTVATGINLTLTTETSFNESTITGGTADYLSNVVNFYLVDTVTAAGGSDSQMTATAQPESVFGFVSKTQNLDGSSSFVKRNEIAVLSNYPVSSDEETHVLYLIMVYNTEVAEYFAPSLTGDVVFASDISIHLERAGGI